MIGKAERPVAPRRKITVTAIVRCRAGRAKMLTTVDFNHQLGGKTDKVGNERPDRLLALETRVQQPMSAQHIPDNAFGLRHRAP